MKLHGMDFKDIQLRINNLMGPKKRIVMEKLTSETRNIHTLYDQHLKNSEEICNLWKNYQEINSIIK